MGGNLFGLGRLARTAYKAIEKDLVRYLDGKFPGLFRIPRYYDSKHDFGDVDVIISKAALQGRPWDEVRGDIVTDLGVEEWKTSGGTFHTNYRNFQVDFFVTPDEYFVTKYNYLSFNDISNLIGKICHRFNVKYGDKGLYYVFRREGEKNRYQKDILLTKDLAKIFAFLGLSKAKWDDGFANLDEMFEWVIASPYFSVQPYRTRSATTQKRIKGRTTINRFLEYLEEHDIDKACVYEEDRVAYIPWIAKSFPEAGLVREIIAEKKREYFEQELSRRYNGKIVMQLFPELKGKQLGNFLEDFQSQWDDWEAVIRAAEPDEVKTWLVDFHDGRNA